MATFPAKTNYAAGNVLTAAQMVDIGEQINALNGNAGKNKIINGDFAINQRGFTSTGVDATFGFDRWKLFYSSGTATYSAQTFTVGTAPVAGYEGINFARLVTSSQSATFGYVFLAQPIEDVRTFAGQTITVSFWAKAASGTPSVAVALAQNFGSGGSPSAQVNQNLGKVTLSTSWQRFTVTGSVPSISGKTIGTSANSSYLRIDLWVSAGSDYNATTNSIGVQSNTFDFWGVQAETGSVATAFQTATGTLAGELQAAQRYYYRNTPAASGVSLGQGSANGSRYVLGVINLPVSMRVAPTSADFSAIYATDGVNAGVTISALAAYGNSQTTATYYFDCTSGLTQYRNYKIDTSSSSGYLGFSAEL